MRTRALVLLALFAGCSRALDLPEGAMSTRAATVAAIGLGDDHSCAVLTSGAMECWGNNADGELGLGYADFALVTTPQRVVGVSDAASVTGGDTDTCSVSPAGAVTCWGALNGVPAPPLLEPTHVLDDARAISMSLLDMCAVLNDGTAVCWGSEDHGELGNGVDETHESTIPMPVVGLHGAVAIGAGEDTTCALLEDGSVQCWGYYTMSNTPVPIQGLPGPATALAVGDMHACALVDGVVFCWGYGGYGELGLGVDVVSSTDAAPITALGPVQAISASGLHSCALLADGTAWCWGGDTTDHAGSFVPVAVPGTADAVTIASGAQHDCVLTSERRVLCWGFNGQGQLGDGTTIDHAEAAAVLLP